MKTAYTSVYKVRKNDTLPLISKVLGVNWRMIYHLNRPKIGNNPEVIQIGSQFLVPTKIVIDSWNTIMGNSWVQDLRYGWSSESKPLEKLISFSAVAPTQTALEEKCAQLKLDQSIGKLLWSMRIENGMNPWKQIVQVLSQLIHLGLGNEVFNKNQNLDY